MSNKEYEELEDNITRIKIKNRYEYSGQRYNGKDVRDTSIQVEKLEGESDEIHKNLKNHRENFYQIFEKVIFL